MADTPGPSLCTPNAKVVLHAPCGHGSSRQTFTLGPARLTAGCVLSQHHFPQDMQVPSQDTQAHIPLIAPLRPVPTVTQAIARLQCVDR